MRTPAACLLAAIALASCGREEARNEIRTSAAEVDRLVHERAAARHAAMASAVATLVPRADLGPCPITVATPAGADDYRFILTPTAGATTAQSPLEHECGRYGSGLLEGLAAHEDLDDLLASARAAVPAVAAHAWDATLLVDEREDPRLAPGDTFVPGTIRGRLLVWSYDDAAFVCAADVVATNGDSVLTFESGSTREEDALYRVRRDLELQALTAGVRALVRAGPRIDPG